MAQMTLGDKQREFTRLVGLLILHAYSRGYELTFGETYRTPEQAAWNAEHGIGIKNSLHTKRLAIDFNLFRDGVYLTASEDYRALGTYWKNLHVLARWGGDFSKPDGGHFSLEHEGTR